MQLLLLLGNLKTFPSLLTQVYCKADVKETPDSLEWKRLSGDTLDTSSIKQQGNATSKEVILKFREVSFKDADTYICQLVMADKVTIETARFSLLVKNKGTAVC